MTACPTCDAPDVHDRYCWTCGTPAGGPVVYPHLPTYSVTGWGIAAVGGMAAVVIVDAGTGLFPLIGRSVPWSRAATLEGVLLGAYLVAVIVAGVSFVTWMVRARRNLEAFPGATPGWSPGWAVAGWVIPLANLVIPFLVMAGIARASLVRARTAPWIAVWWIGYLAATALWNLGGALADERASGYDPAWDPAAYYASVSVPGNMVSTSLLAASGVAIGVLVIRVSRAQEDRLDRAARLAAAAPVAAPPVPGPAAPVAPQAGPAVPQAGPTAPPAAQGGDATIGR